MNSLQEQNKAHSLQESVDKTYTFPASFAQQRLWFLDRLLGASGLYNISWAIQLYGKLDVSALQQSLNTIVARHEVLRTHFVEQNGEPVQVIRASMPFACTLMDLSAHPQENQGSEIQRMLDAEANKAFDLKQAPLIRALLLKLSGQEHILLISIHHIVADGCSRGVFKQELASLYGTFSQGQSAALPELPVQYADYAVWQREWLQGEVLERQLSYWKTQLADLTLLELPADKPRPKQQSYRGARAAIHLSAALTQGLKTLSQQHNVTLFMTLLAAFQVLLHRYSGQDDIVVGSPIAGRNKQEVENLIGLFVNTLVLRTDLSGAPSFVQLLSRVHEVCLSAYAHQDIPFEKLVAELQVQRDMSRHPLFQVMLVLQPAALQDMQLPGLTISKLTVSHSTAKFDLALSLAEHPDGLTGRIEYSTDLFNAETITRLAGHFQTLLEAIALRPETAIAELPLLTAPERHQLLVEWNATRTDYPKHKFIHQLFEEQVARTPDAIALVFEDQQLSYQALNAQANQLAHHLRNIGVGPEVLVGICLERSLDMVVGLLGILKAGGAYLPLDPAYPKERLALMLEDSAPLALLTQGRLEKLFAGVSKCLPVIDLSAKFPAWASEPDTNPDHSSVGLTSENLAYVIYTSGSTGKPKGAGVLHRGLQNLLPWYIGETHLSCDDAVLVVTSMAFDLTQRVTYGPLLAGARLVLASEPFDPQAIVTLVAKERISMMNLTPSGFHTLIDASTNGELGGLRRVFLGGEPMQPSRLLELPEPRPEFVNNYGPTECTATATFYRVPSDLEQYRNRSVPIGRPIANTRIYILDTYQQPVPIGVVGEIHIGGAPVGRGYLNQPELTAERFVRDPFVPEADARMYKTGDLARWLADGAIEFLGRNDFQVKIRGFRIEPGEIEAQLLQQDTVSAAIVMLHGVSEADKRLIAYIIPHTGADINPGELRAALKANLPEFMIPSAFVLLDKLPLTPNGKIDRKALPAPDQTRPEFEQSYVPPRSPIEEMLVTIWREVLNIDQIGIHDNFFESGGHSLLAMQLIVRINKQFQIDFPLYSLFEAPTVAGLSVQLEAILKQENTSTITSIKALHRKPYQMKKEPMSSFQEQNNEHSLQESVDNRYAFPTSFAQQRLWFLDRLLGASGLYNIPWAIQLNGKLDVSALQQSLNAIVARHEVLRTCFIEQDGEPFQVIRASIPFACTLMALSAHPQEHRNSEIQRILHAEGNKPFDLKEAPLIRASLLKLSEQEHILLISIHHIVSDGWSMGVLRQELASLYGAFSQGQPANLPELPVQYADYAVWQREWLQGEVLERQLSYWKTQLADLTVLELPVDKPRPKQLSYRGARQTIHLSAALTQGLKTLSQQHNVTLFMTLLAAFQVLLYRYSGQEDIVVGTAIAGRNRQEIENLIGFFVNTLALRTDLSGAPSFVQLLSRVREICLSAYAHQDIPFEKLVAELQVQRDMSRNPLFQVMMVLHTPALQEMQLSGLTISKLTVTNETAKDDLALLLQESSDGLTGAIEYSTNLFNAETITRLAGHFQSLLEAIVEHPETDIAELPLLTALERHQLLVEWNATKTGYPKDKCIHQLFEEQVARTPDAIALVFEDQQLSYQVLNAKANQLARYLRTLGVGPDTLVGICVERGPDMILGLLGILKAGGAYVPLDPAYPKGRLAFILEDSAPVALLIDAEAEEILAEAADNIPRVNFAAGKAHWVEQSGANLSRQATGLVPEHLAYVIYTSGSTGQPKGVMIEHRSLCNQIVALQTFYQLCAEDRILQFASFAFDVSVEEIFGTLNSGATLVLRTDVWLTGAHEFWALCDKHRVTVANLPTLFWQQLVLEDQAAMPSTLRQVIIGGDAVSDEALENWFKRNGYRPRLFNAYGPTESTINASINEPLPDALSSQSIGHPIANTQIYILDTLGQPVPVGVTGELYIGGAGVARGYLGRPELTAERFLADPFVVEPAARMYKTGDLGRWLTDGTIEFLGRNDFQVKIRGFRIELGEIEARLAAHPKLREAAVLAREDHLGDKRLVAYYTGDEDLAVEDLRAHLVLILPDYMVPAAYVRLEALPLTPNGKLDRKALPAPEGQAYVTRIYEAPQGETEQALASIWAELLKIERVGRHDNFFELGGHSLLAMQLIVRINKQFQIDFPLYSLFEAPTVAGLSVQLETILKQENTSIITSIKALHRKPYQIK